MTQPLATATRVSVGQPSSVRIGVVTSVNPLAVTVQGKVFLSSALGVVGDYLPSVGDIVALLGQSSNSGSDPTSWLVLGDVHPGTGTFATPGTRWQALGTAEAPFAANWSNVGAPFRNGAYRRTDDGNVELAGLIQFSSTAAAPTTMFTLPVGFRPIGGDVQPYATVSNNPASAAAPTPRGIVITTAGLVRVTHYVGVINPGPVSLDGLIFSITTI